MQALLLLLLFLVLDLPSASAGTPPRTFRAGAATSNITPPLGTPIVGGFRPFPARHIHDELHARCVAFDNGQTKIAIVVCDLLGAHQLVFEEAHRLIAADTSLPAASVFISCTHTHSAGTALGTDRFSAEPTLDDYQRFVARRIADAVRCALNNLAPAEIGWTVAAEPREVFNRRWFMKPGTVPVNPFGETTDLVKMNPPRASANLDKPSGPTDPEISILAVRAPGGRPIAVLASYSLHYVGGVPGADVSADYFGVFCREALPRLLGAEKLDPPFVALLANGTSGNINNIDFSKPDEKRAPYEKMRAVAHRVAESTHQAYQGILWKNWAPLSARLEKLHIGHRRPTAEQLARAKSLVQAASDRDAARSPAPALSLDEVYAERVVRMADWPATIPLPLQALRIGDVAIGGIPAEVFVETGLAFKQRSPFQPSFIISLNNGYYGYLPTPEHHKLGGYETWLGTNRLEVEASTKILDHLLKMVESMR